MVNNTRDIASCIHGTCAKTVVVSFHSWNKYIVQFAVPLGEHWKKNNHPGITMGSYSSTFLSFSCHCLFAKLPSAAQRFASVKSFLTELSWQTAVGVADRRKMESVGQGLSFPMMCFHQHGFSFDEMSKLIAWSHAVYIVQNQSLRTSSSIAFKSVMKLNPNIHRRTKRWHEACIKCVYVCPPPPNPTQPHPTRFANSKSSSVAPRVATDFSGKKSTRRSNLSRGSCISQYAIETD